MSPKRTIVAVLMTLSVPAAALLAQNLNSTTFTNRAKDAAAAASAAGSENPPTAAPAPRPPASSPAPAPVPAAGNAGGTRPPAASHAPGQPVEEMAEGQALQQKATSQLEEARREEEESLSDEGAGYDPRGRRDPFKPLVGGTNAETEERGNLPGIAGILSNEVKLIGIVVDGDQNVAIFFGGPDNMGYFVREGQSFFDGLVYKIDHDEGVVTIRKKVEDPRSLVKFRDQFISLHPTEGETKQ